jgi:glycosyltransferase involved in cell wall biosynthesis
MPARQLDPRHTVTGSLSLSPPNSTARQEHLGRPCPDPVVRPCASPLTAAKCESREQPRRSRQPSSPPFRPAGNVAPSARAVWAAGAGGPDATAAHASLPARLGLSWLFVARPDTPRNHHSSRSPRSISDHIIVTPARNEADNLRRLGASLIAQTWRPAVWIVVENGSTDDTAAVIRDLAADHDWIRLLSVEPPKQPRRGSASARAFNLGIAAVEFEPHLITNVDADVSYEPDYFDKLRDEFESNPQLGIASGLCFEHDDGDWKPVHVTSPNLRGASFTYRAECFAQLPPREERLGWEAIDIVRAGLRGWDTATISGLGYFHHRATGARDANRFAAWAEEGAVSYSMWYRPLYLAVRAAYRVVSARDLAPAGLVWGYARSAIRRDARHAEPGFRQLVHERQALRNLTSRFREARGTPTRDPLRGRADSQDGALSHDLDDGG